MGKSRWTKKSKARPAWYVETTADGGAHHGLHADGVVRADCGRTFIPLDMATRHGTVMRWDEPVDEMHACAACWAKVHGKGTSFYEVASG